MTLRFFGFLTLVLCVAVAALFQIQTFQTCQATDAPPTPHSSPFVKINRLQDLNGKLVGTLVGTFLDQVAEKNLDYVTVKYFDDYDQMEIALLHGEIDALWGDEPVMRNRANANPLFRVLEEKVEESFYGFAFRQTDVALRNQIDGILQLFLKNGEIERLTAKWLDDNEISTHQINVPQAARGEVLRLGTCKVLPPFTFTNDKGEPSGMDIEMARMIAARLNRPLEILVMEFGELIPALLNNRVDVIGGAITITPERQKIISFSTGYFGIGVVALVRK